MDVYKEMYWKLYSQVSQVIEELEAVRADTEALFLAADEQAGRDGTDSLEEYEDERKEADEELSWKQETKEPHSI